MNTRLSKATKLKLIIPIGYLGLAVAYFVLSWPANLDLRHIAGMSTTLASFIFWIVARIQLGNAFSLAPRAKFLVKSGMYAKLRHPVYYFSILAALGLTIYTWSLVAVALALILTTLEVIRIRKEDGLLQKTFGKTYSEYREQTWF